MKNGPDYYQILEIKSVNASHEDVTREFRRLALKYHPLKSKDKIAENMLKFSKICEAYDVLSKPELK